MDRSEQHYRRFLSIKVCFSWGSLRLGPCPECFELVYQETWHRSQRRCSIVKWRNLVTGRKAPLVVGGTQTQVLADIIAIAESALKPLNHLDHFPVIFHLQLVKVGTNIYHFNQSKFSKVYLANVFTLCNTYLLFISSYTDILSTQRDARYQQIRPCCFSPCHHLSKSTNFQFINGQNLSFYASRHQLSELTVV